jgi:hypothetical protein
MPYSSRNIEIACNHAGLTHFGGIYVFRECSRVLQHSAPPVEDCSQAETRSQPFTSVP